MSQSFSTDAANHVTTRKLKQWVRHSLSESNRLLTSAETTTMRFSDKSGNKKKRKSNHTLFYILLCVCCFVLLR
ncbi:unnamed protein product [Larinioides sclopetarius]|uniref:Uncharacterized protein n=1 Tax=Larinioides sclopetarius TaxID=280406 RepID=A0AAV1ZNK6_9ARAC